MLYAFYSLSCEKIPNSMVFVLILLSTHATMQSVSVAVATSQGRLLASKVQMTIEILQIHFKGEVIIGSSKTNTSTSK